MRKQLLLRRAIGFVGGENMPIFIVLGRWTDQGIRKITESTERAKVAHDMVKKAGGKMQLFYTMGKYDFTVVMEVPKDEDAMAILLCLGSMGNIRTMTMKAWKEEDAAKLLTAPHP
jgi:uncharacterized protein with GYD domain